MIKIFKKDVFVDENNRATLISIDTDIGLVTLIDISARRNKWLTTRTISDIEICPGRGLSCFIKNSKLHVRNDQEFLHRVLMTIGEAAYYRDGKTRVEIEKYRRENAEN